MRITSDLLETIVAASRTAAREREAVRHIGPPGTASPPRASKFIEALRSAPPPRIIAECKRRSPSRGILRDAYDPAAHAVSYASAGAAAISVLTEPTFFDGSLDHLASVRAAVSLPVLRKDFIVTEYQVREAATLGADAVLLIVAALSQAELRDLLDASTACGLAALVEVHDAEDLDRALEAGARVVGVNSRNLRTLDVDLRAFEQLVPAIPTDVVRVAESGIRTPADVARYEALGFDAFLVGERLITEPDPGAALRALRQR